MILPENFNVYILKYAKDLLLKLHTVLQIFVEIERARLTRRLAIIREAEGNIAEAADTLQEVPVVSLNREAGWSMCLLNPVRLLNVAKKSGSML
jgi:hypothetical protein